MGRYVACTRTHVIYIVRKRPVPAPATESDHETRPRRPKTE